jgi:hypothetical protein
MDMEYIILIGIYRLKFFLIIQYRFYNGIQCRCFTIKDQAYTSKYIL